MMVPEIRVGLVDDHQILRDGLRTVIQSGDEGIAVAGEAGTAADALRMLEEEDLDVLVTDVSMPGLSGLQLASKIRDAGDRPRVIVLSMFDDADIIEQAVKAGVWGYLLKENASDLVVQAIKAVHRGKRFFSPSIPEEDIASYRYSGETRETKLTPRQLDVIGLICQGKTEREIAEALGISPHTAHVHKNNILQTLHLHSKVEVVKYAVQHGLVQL